LLEFINLLFLLVGESADYGEFVKVFAFILDVSKPDFLFLGWLFGGWLFSGWLLDGFLLGDRLLCDWRLDGFLLGGSGAPTKIWTAIVVIIPVTRRVIVVDWFGFGSSSVDRI